jgi:hypothetical protein
MRDSDDAPLSPHSASIASRCSSVVVVSGRVCAQRAAATGRGSTPNPLHHADSLPQLWSSRW